MVASLGAIMPAPFTMLPTRTSFCQDASGGGRFGEPIRRQNSFGDLAKAIA
jgi:hypothetical protein